MIITGGVYENTRKIVTEYTEAGFKRNLPQLRTDRIYHGCGYYENDNKIKVKRSLPVDFDISIVESSSDIPRYWWISYRLH